MSNIGLPTDYTGRTDDRDESQEWSCHRVCVLLSGGVDSSACVGYYVSKGYDVGALFIDYGQPHADKEAAAATAISEHYGIALKKLTVQGYAPPDGYVPGRNAVLLSLALMATTFTCGLIGLGIHSGTPYADCTSDFCGKMQKVCDLYTGGQVQIDAPFAEWTKSEIWDYARAHGVPLDVTHTSNPDDLVAHYE